MSIGVMSVTDSCLPSLDLGKEVYPPISQKIFPVFSLYQQRNNGIVHISYQKAFNI